MGGLNGNGRGDGSDFAVYDLRRTSNSWGGGWGGGDGDLKGNGRSRPENVEPGDYTEAFLLLWGDGSWF